MLASEKLPYDRLERGLLPNVFFGLLLGSPAGQVASGEYLAPYLGALPLLLAALGIWKCWANPWVRYFTAMLGASFLYSLGSYSLLHGLSYVFIPFLWLAREAGRFMYLVDFSVAVLAGFGAERLFAACSGDAAWACLKKPLGWVVAGCILAMAVPAVYGKPDLSPLVSSSLLMVILSCGLVLYILHGHRGAWSRALVLSLILFDLYAFDWSASNVAQAASTGGDHLERLLSFDAAAKFLKSRGGLFRVKMAMDYAPNVGDAFGIPTLWGSGVSVPANYNKIRESSDDLLNIRYVVRPASASEPGAIYQDRFWKIYENPTYFPRAWLVHEATVDGANLDPRRTALLARPLALALDPADDSGGESVGITRYLPNSIELRVQAGGRALLVLSEVFYPGWRATVNGRSVAILEVDRALRGIPVPKGESRVVVSYAPRSVYAGAAFTLGSFFALPLAAVWLLRSRTKSGGTADYGNQST
jgi:hypothetical protein